MDWPTKAVDWAIVFGTAATIVLAVFAVVAFCWEWFLKKLLNSPKLDIELLDIKDIRFEKPIDFDNREDKDNWRKYFTIRVINSKPSREAKEVRVRLLEFLLREKKEEVTEKGTEKSSREILVYVNKPIPAPPHFDWAAPTDESPSTRTSFTTYDAFCFCYFDKNIKKLFLTTNPCLESVHLPLDANNEVLIAVEISAHNAAVPLRKYIKLKVEWSDTSENFPDNKSVFEYLFPVLKEITKSKYRKTKQSKECAVK